MTIELLLCIGLAFVALPVSHSVWAHYVAFALVNWMFMNATSADASLLAMTFGALAAIDAALILSGATLWLLPAFIASAALSIESVSNGDWLLSHSTPISIATNAVIIAHLAREYLAWMRGRYGQ